MNEIEVDNKPKPLNIELLLFIFASGILVVMFTCLFTEIHYQEADNGLVSRNPDRKSIMTITVPRGYKRIIIEQ